MKVEGNRWKIGMKSLFERLWNWLRNPVLNLILNVCMLLMNAIACISQFLEGNMVMANVLFVSVLSCISAVVYWVLITWDSRRRK